MSTYYLGSMDKMLLSVQLVFRLGRPLVPWTIIEVQAEQSFNELFGALQAGQFDCVPVSGELKDATLHQTYVGQKIELLMITSSTQSVFAVCSQFGTYVKFLIK